jgi:hypothetical protein
MEGELTIDKTTGALLGGAFLYSLAFVALSAIDIPELRIVGTNISPFIYLTPLFGLPYLLVGRPGPMRIFYFLILVPIVHDLAITAAISVAANNAVKPADIFGGAVGGLVGAALSFAMLMVTSPSARTSAALKTALGGTILLCAIGAVGLHFSFVRDDDLSFIILYLPWQLVFALCLGRMLREQPVPVTARLAEG